LNEKDEWMEIASYTLKNRDSWGPSKAGPVVMPARPDDITLYVTDPVSLIDKVSEAIGRTHAYYEAQQNKDGYWWYELESNVTMTSEYLMFLHFLGLRDKEKDGKIAYHILQNQRANGSWSLYWGDNGDLSTSIEAYFALKIAGYSSDDKSLRQARAFILEKGGVEASRVFTKIFLALFGEFDWKAIPSIPLEINLLPPWFPLNIYRFSSWARSTLVPLSMILELKPVRSLPEHSGIRELYKNPHEVPPLTPKRLPTLSWKRFFIVQDRVFKVMETLPIRPFRDKALRETERWIVAHQESSGDWGGIQPAMINSVLALAAAGYNVASEPIKKGLKAIEEFSVENERELHLQACISPVWDTALTSLALFYSGMERNHPSLIKACRWLASKQIFKKGDWSVKRPDLEGGGWAFEFENSWYPDVDDSAVVLLFLNRYEDHEFIKPENMQRGLDWILGMQGKDGGWGAFDVDNNMRLLNQLPFGDLEAMIDPSTPDVTGRVLELLGLLRYSLSDNTVKRAIAFLRKTQEKDGSWWGRWGVNYIYGTWSVLMGLRSIGEDMTSPYVRKAVQWLKNKQNFDGGWGESCESYNGNGLDCRSASTPSQTAWAILALLAAGDITSEEVLRGITYLVERQEADGTWDEEEFTGTGFPKFFFLRYHNYRNCFPLMALGQFLSICTEKGTYS
jgi:squalene-hopene/tetraprenyl-beta-curcumene cyclase